MSPPAARAAHWVVTYQTSGTTNGTDYGNNNKPYTTIWPVAGPNGGGSPPSGYGSGMETSHGTITPVLTWTADSGDTSLPPAPDPAEAVIYVSITASIDGNNGRGTSPCHTSASDSFGDSFTTTTSGTQQTTSGAFCHLAQMSNSGGSTQVNLPAITLDAACSTDGSNQGGSTVINVVATPVNIVLAGVTVGGGKNNILIGQGCTGSWVPIKDGGGRVYGTLSNYQWTVSGSGTSLGSRFQSWIVSSDQHTGKLTPGIGPTNQPTAHWYWNEATAIETVSCTATCSPPPNLGQPFTVTSTQKVLVAEPTYACTHSEGTPYVTPDGLTLRATPTDNSGHGETWFCNVQTPALFGKGGSCNFCLIITPYRSHTYSTGTVPCTENTKTGLDTVFPYPAESGDPYTGTGINAGWPADNSQHHSGDSPATATHDEYGTRGVASSVYVNEDFNTYLMYLPPGTDVQPVPLHEIDWNWNAAASEPAGGWATTNGIILGSVTSKSSARDYKHPEWTRLEGASVVGTGW